VGETKHRVAEAERLEHDVERIRERLTEVVSELDRRRHALMDWRGQIRKHSGLLGLIGASLAILVGASVVFRVWRARYPPKPPRFGRRAPPPPPPESVGHKVLAASAATVVAVAAKAIARRAVGWIEPSEVRTTLH
jgi:hypothetical protein